MRRLGAGALLAVTTVMLALGLSACTATAVSAKCAAAMSTAASASDDASNAALIETTKACTAADEWIAALKDNPSAGALTSYTTDDAKSFLNTVCVRSYKSRVCIDAEKQGYLTFKLDDPRLKDLNNG